MLRIIVTCVSLLALTSLSHPQAPAQVNAKSEAAPSMSALANRLPGGANAVLAINVQKLLASPLGKEAQLQSKLMKGYADRPLAVPASARRIAVGAAVHPVGMRSIWETAVIELWGTPQLEPMLREQGGYLDKIENHPAAWTPRDTFYLALDEHTLAVARPAQRQLVRTWLTGKDRPRLSPYITSARVAGGGADVIFIVDLHDIVGVPALHYAYGMGRLPSLEDVDGGGEKLLPALATVRGMTMSMHVTDKITAQWIIDFEQSVAGLGAQAKPFVIDVLSIADLYEPGSEQWQFKAEGKRIIGTGTMDLAGLNRLIGLLSPVHVGDADAATQVPTRAADGQTVEPAEARPAASVNPQERDALASQSYYRAVSKMLDLIGVKPSPQQGATWLVAQARAIEQLPLVDVDPELATWGATVADAFYRAAQELAVGQHRAQVAAERIESPVAATAWTPSGTGTGDTPESRAAFRNAQRQRREAAQNERGQAAERAFGVLNEIMPTRAKIRAAMVQKYGVEF